MQDLENIMVKVNKSKRRKLMAFIKEYDKGEEEATIIPAGSRDELPKTKRQDKGTLAIILVGISPYNGKKGLWVLIDTIDKDGKETLTKYYKPAAIIAELVGSPSGRPIKAGRKKRIFTDEEKQRIAELRAQGVGIARIARELKTSNRLIMGVLPK